MNRLLATIRCDLRLQARNGFYHAAAFILAMWALIISQLPALNLGWLLPAMLLNNLLVGTFYFVGGLLLLEKTEGTLAARVITPLRAEEYLVSKVLTLGALALAQNAILAGMIYGPGLRVAPLLAGIAAAAAIYVLAGFIVVVRYDSVNEYLFPSLPYAALLMLPLAYTAGWDHWLLDLHPMQPPLLLMRAAFEPAPAWQLIYGALGSALWVGLGLYLARRAFRRLVVERVGGAA